MNFVSTSVLDRASMLNKRSPFHLNSRKWALWLVLAGVIGLSGLTGVISVRLAIAQQQAPNPQALLVLEGDTDRIRFTAQFSKSHPGLPIWVSGNPEGFNLNQSIFRQAGVPLQQVHYDFCATDTVTNFTCNADEFNSQHIQHVYVVTSTDHMPRSLAIGAIVFGSHGITSTPLIVPSDAPAESWLRILRDCIRCVIWLMTGWTAANLNPSLHRF
jgi:uncharacterized SAM-binding protein YcdF (DUF218 family)